MNEVRAVQFEVLGSTRMIDISPDGFEITGVPLPPSCTRLNLQARNHRHFHGDSGQVYVFADVSFEAPLAAREAYLRRIHASFPSAPIPTQLTDVSVKYKVYTREHEDTLAVDIDVLIDLTAAPYTTVTAAIAPLLGAFRHMSDMVPHAFICHASEDKPTARQIASFLRGHGATVWLDEWEIRVGDSIVQKISSGLEASSHLILLLSQHSVSKPWVQREFSAALMRQLATSRVAVLPVRLDDSLPPQIIADLKYADARYDLGEALIQLRNAIFEP